MSDTIQFNRIYLLRNNHWHTRVNDDGTQEKYHEERSIKPSDYAAFSMNCSRCGHIIDWRDDYTVDEPGEKLCLVCNV